jgi:preprotein translocase subunit SecA
LATNIAGRGTDIVLGEGVRELGGLVVVGSERHEARRIDNQLRGRGGRQGDPGLTQFYVSTEDDLMRIFQGERIASLMDRLGVDEETPIQNRAVSRTLENAQKKVEGYNFDTRKNVVQYDNVMNRHRKAVYSMRRQILERDDISSEVKELIEEAVRQLTVFAPGNQTEFAEQFEVVIPLKKQAIEKLKSHTKEKERFEAALKATTKFYKDREKEFGSDIVRKLEREIYLQVLDTLWMQHLENMQHLRDGIHWRSIGQRDPLVEYRQESQRLFEQLQATLRDEVVRAIFHVTRQDLATKDEEFDTDLTRAAEQSVERGVNEIADMERTANFEKKSENIVKKKKAEARKKRKRERQNKKHKH